MIPTLAKTLMLATGLFGIGMGGAAGASADVPEPAVVDPRVVVSALDDDWDDWFEGHWVDWGDDDGDDDRDDDWGDD